jgi:hypothetical protein
MLAISFLVLVILAEVHQKVHAASLATAQSWLLQSVAHSVALTKAMAQLAPMEYAIMVVARLGIHLTVLELVLKILCIQTG